MRECTLILNNSMCRIEGLPAKDFAALKGVISYQIGTQQAFFAGAHRPQRRYLMDAKGSFPSGLIYLVEGFLEKRGIEYRRVDKRIEPKARAGLFSAEYDHTPYPEQFEAAQAAVQYGRGIIVAPTGTGKSLVCALIVARMQVPVLVVVPTLELKRQLTESLVGFFGADRVGPLGSPCAIENIDALPMKPLKGYDCVIIDEFHHSAAKTYRKLNQKAWNGVYHRFGLTATPFRSNTEERLLLESILSKVIYRVNYAQAIERGYIVPIEAYYYDLPMLDMKGNEANWHSVYSELVVNNKRRNTLIAKILNSLRDQGASTLCLVREIAHGEALANITQCPFANGEDGNAQAFIKSFNDRTTHALIGTVGVLGEGVDTRPAEFILIAGAGKSKNQFMQNCGRGFRKHPGKESCKIILFRDKSHKYLLRHFNAQVKHLKEEYGILPVKLSLPPENE